MQWFPQLSSIKVRRKALGISQQKLAGDAGISQSLLAKIEKGSVVPNYEIAVRIFDRLEELENAGQKTAYSIMNPKVIVLQWDDIMAKAIKLAKLKGISQFPVGQDGRIIGALKTSDMLDADKNDKVVLHMSPELPTVHANVGIEAIKALVKTSGAVIVVENGKAIGIITLEEML